VPLAGMVSLTWLADMYTRFCSSVLFPIHERIKGHRSVALRRELEQTQWWSAERLQSMQLDRLRSFLQRAERQVPYYRETFERIGLRPDDVRTLQDFQAIPLLDKPTIRANTDRLRSSCAGKLARFNTGGSSGEPLVFFLGEERVSHDVAAKWRATRWWGVDIGDTEVVLWGSPIELGRQDRVKWARDRMLRSNLLPAFQMSETQMDSYLDTLEHLRPRMLFGYASALALLASYAEKGGRTLRRLGIRVVFTTGETLFPDQRRVMERVFGAPVANGYGSRDAGFIAHQCPSGSLHVSSEHIIVELVDGAGRPAAAGATGEIVTTHLATGDFPFVRYRTGDMGSWSTEPCPCGRGLPALKEVAGRATDFVRTPSGNTMHALALIYEVRDKPGVSAFKFIQAPDLSVELLVVAGSEFTVEVASCVRDGVLARMGAGGKFAIRRVSDIPPEPSGKYRYVVSHAGPCAAGQQVG